MFEGLNDRLEGVVKTIKGLHKLTEENISTATRDVRMALLEADVNVAVVKEFIAGVKEELIGEKTSAGIDPGQHFIKVVHDKLVEILGGQSAEIEFSQKGPTIILMTGLQGSGKTTTTAKLARWISKKGYTPMVVSVDVYRPAAMDQLKILAGELDIALYDADPGMAPVDTLKKAIKAMDHEKANVLLVDTAGRLHIDTAMMDELKLIKKAVKPTETLFVADSMTGQDAVTVAGSFNETIGMTGVVLTKLDGDTRGGAALSIKKVTGAPIKFVGVGEKLDQLEAFHPDRAASRILGMGDVMTLIEKAQDNIDQKQARVQANKMLSANFDLNDFLEQLQMIKKMGPLDQLMKMIPGASAMMKSKEVAPDPDELVRVEAIINSMTLKERARPGLVNTSRKRRIARGSGTQITDVNNLLRQFQKTRKMMKGIGKMSGKNKKGMANPLAEFGLGGMQ